MEEEAEELTVLLTKFHRGNPNLDRWLAWLERAETREEDDTPR